MHAPRVRTNLLFAPRHPAVQSRIGHVLVLDDRAGAVEEPEVAFARKLVLLSASDVGYIHRD
jgi:hypothetical protein